MKTRDLRDSDLDSIWTPKAFWTPFGLHTGLHGDAPTARPWHRTCFYARGRPCPLMFAHECGDNILPLI